METVFLSSQEINKEEWDGLVIGSPQGSIFCRSWYLDAQPGEWQGILVSENNMLQAVMPFKVAKKLFMEYALQPRFSRYWGICFRKREFKSEYEEYSWKRKLILAILGAIPKNLVAFEYNFHPSFDYALPFHWKGYELKLAYTYRLDLTQGEEAIRKKFSDSRKKDLRKAASNGLKVVEEHGTDLLLSLLRANELAGKKIIDQKSYPIIGRIFEACKSRDHCFGKTVYLEDKAISSCLFLKDEHTTYFLAGYVDPAYKQTAAVALAVQEAIQEAAKNTQAFDFMGSMIESIEGYFRNFSPAPVPFINISKYRKPLKFLKG